MKSFVSFIRKSIVSLLWIIVASGPMYGFDKTFTFDLADFSLISMNGILHIKPKNIDYYSFDLNQVGYPRIPFYEYRMTTEKACNLSSLRYHILEKRIVAENVDIQRSLPLVPTGEATDDQPFLKNVVFSSYPDSIIRLYNGPVWNDNRIVLSIAPFIYDQPSRSLFFVSQIRVSYDECDTERNQLNAENEENTHGLLGIDYLIITHDSLVDSFKELRNWKTAKGVKTKIVTVDSIHGLYTSPENNYSESQKIKLFIMGSSARMVLLGGDKDIVPSQDCKLDYRYINGFTNTDTLYTGHVLSDMFYSCTGGDWTWDYNHIGYVGEIGTDGVVLTPTIAVSRLPVRTKDELSIYIQKLLQYEKNPGRDNYASRLLLSGSKAHWHNPANGKSDAHIESEIMYEEAFLSDTSKYRNIYRNYFYDTGNSLGRVGDDAVLNSSNLSSVINSFRPHFLNMYCHGSSTLWSFGTFSSFTKTNARELENDNAPMVIATNACHTADFSQNSPCLAEAFLFHPSGGAIVYWGSSDLGFSSREEGQVVDASTAMCLDFWKSLPDTCSFGMAVLNAKYKRSHNSDTITNTNNWLLKSMNALGDCEVPIYTEDPREITNIRIEINYGDVEAISDDYNVYRMAIVSKGDNGESNFYVNESTALGVCPFNHKASSICLTKHNYIPFYVETGRFACLNEKVSLFLQNQIYKGNVIHYGDDYDIHNIYIGNHVDNDNETGDVVVETGTEVTFDATERVTISSGFNCHKGGILKINNPF